MTTTQNQPTRYARPGAVKAQNGGDLPIRRCETCNGEIVFCKSARTGKFYAVNVSYTKKNDAAYYRGDNLHACRPEVTVFAIVITSNGKQALINCENESHMLQAAITTRRVAQWNTADDNVTESRQMRWTTRLVCNSTGVLEWLAHAETLAVETFPEVAQ